MSASNLRDLPSAELDRLEEIVARFKQAWRTGPRPALNDFLVVEPALRQAVLVELIHADMEFRCLAGDTFQASAYLQAYPALAAERGVVLELLRREFDLRRELDPRLAPAGFAEQYPSYRDELLAQLTGGSGSAANPGGETVRLPPTVVRADTQQPATQAITPECAAFRRNGYEILGVLGRGGMGVVYKARHLKLKRLVALKMILAGGHAGDQERERFRVEAEAVARLQHPHIVQIHEVGEQEGRPFFSLELVEGGSLARKLGGLPHSARYAAEMVEMLARAMHYAHERGIIHRDLKPANVLLTQDGQPKIGDFGLAKRLDDDHGQTRSGAVVGTPAYMAPEQALGKVHELGPAADGYALGAILYEMLTGRPPFMAETSLGILQQVTTAEPVPPSRLHSSVPQDLVTICLKCLRKEPHQRYATALALAEDLRRFLNHEPIQARPVGQWERALKWASRRPALAAVYVLAGLLMVFGLATTNAVWLWQRADKARELAERAQRGEAEAREQLDHNLYLRRVDLAHREWLANNAGRADQLLDECPEERRHWEWHYVKRLCHPELLTLKGHTSWINSVAFSPDGRQVASASQDGTVRVWDAATGRGIHVLQGHTGPTTGAWSVAFSADWERLASCGDDKTVKVWDLRNGHDLLTLTGHTNSVTRLALSRDGTRLATGSIDQTVKIWDATTGNLIHTLKGHTSAIGGVGVTFSPDGRLIASCGSDQAIKIWDAASGQGLFTLKGHTKGVASVAFSPDGKRLVSASIDRTVKVWDLAARTEIFTLTGHALPVTGAEFSPDGKRLVSSSHDMTVKLWDAATGRELHTFKGHGHRVNSVAFSPDGQRLVTGSSDNTVKIWDVVALAHDRLTLRGHTDGVNDVAFSPDGQRLATASTDTSIRIWDATNVRQVAAHRSTLAIHQHRVAYRPDGRALAAVGGHMVKILHPTTGEELRTVKGRECVAFSPDSKLLATCNPEDGDVLVYDPSTGQLVRTLRGHARGFICVAFSHDGNWLAAGSGPESLTIVWDLAAGKAIHNFRGGYVQRLAFSPDDRLLATANGYHTLTVWDLTTGQEEFTLKGHTAAVAGVAFSPDGKRLASCGGDDSVKVWDTATGQEVLTLKGHSDGLTSVAFSPDGHRLASSSRDQTVRFWDATPLPNR